jgi:hypothetical protein
MMFSVFAFRVWIGVLGAIYATHVVDKQVCLLTGFIGQLYDVCVPLRQRFVPDSKTPCMTVDLCDSVRERDAMNSRAHGSHAVTRRVAALIKTAAACLPEIRFDQALPPKVLWSNFRSIGFCNSSDFSSLGISADDFADFSAPQVIVPPDLVRLDDAGFSFRHFDCEERLAACMGIKSKLHFYLSRNRSDLDGLITRVNEDLEVIHRWSIEYGLLLNPAKLQVILFSNSPPGDIVLEWKNVVTDVI